MKDRDVAWLSSKALALWACGVLLAFSCASLGAAPVPTPESHFGHKIGADRELLDWDKVVSYFYSLAKSSDRIQVAEYGRSAENRPMIVATIADPATLKNLAKYREIQRRLADPRITSPTDAEPMFREGKNVILMTCSIHATEVASTHSAVEFAYRLITESNPRFEAILHNTILLLVPSLNPDGVDIVTRWYRRTLNTKWEGTNPPELYQKYVGHDNNRDWYIFSQPETRATISQLHNVWHPEIVYDVHQQGPGASRIFIPPWLDPIEPNIDPILAQEMNMMGTSMASDLTAAGKTGVAIHAAYDFWTPSRHYQAFHGGLRILTESASARLATPITIKPDQIDTTALGYDPRERSWNYLQPWLGGTWRLRDIIDYQELAYESLLYNAALHREEMLRSFYKVGEDQVARISPWGAVISKNQRDPAATRKMLETLQAGMVEISQDSAGDYVIPFQQPYSGYAKALLERQDYPNELLYPGGPPKRPYDVTAHTLPLLFGVDSKFVDQPVSGGLKRASLGVPARKDEYAASDTDGWKAANAAWAGGRPVWRDENGDFSMTSRGAGWREIRKPRVGLYRSFMANMDEGWTRWLLEEFGFAYTPLRNADIQAGNLRDKFDAIVFADEQPNAIQNGHVAGSMPPEFTGGLGQKGEDALRAFANAGGTLVFLNRASNYATQHLGVKATNVLAGVAAKDFYCPGSLLNAVLDTHSPLTRGLPQNVAVWTESGPAWDTSEPSVAKFADSKVLASGWLLGEGHIAGKTALIDAKSGNGHIVLFGMRPQYRAQSYLTFKLLFNALVMNL
ncbi:MAG TPA: M14 metallopeptidase family protein [Bryobacteraceae bacterium]|nr:M14 metallopeptidase family protein [Bryobacteraceae bacterium]